MLITTIINFQSLRTSRKGEQSNLETNDYDATAYASSQPRCPVLNPFQKIVI